MVAGRELDAGADLRARSRRDKWFETNRSAVQALETIERELKMVRSRESALLAAKAALQAVLACPWSEVPPAAAVGALPPAQKEG